MGNEITMVVHFLSFFLFYFFEEERLFDAYFLKFKVYLHFYPLTVHELNIYMYSVSMYYDEKCCCLALSMVTFCALN